MKSFFLSLAKKFVCFYQQAISIWLPRSCRHIPSCSNYALDALDEHGLLKGSWLTLKRIFRCHPWGTSGFDPVPKKERHHEVLHSKHHHC